MMGKDSELHADSIKLLAEADHKLEKLTLERVIELVALAYQSGWVNGQLRLLKELKISEYIGPVSSEG